MEAPQLHLNLLGGFHLARNGQPVAGLESPRLQALLAFLTLRYPAPQPRQQLAFLLWPDSDERQARTNLRNLLHRLRQTWPAADELLEITTKRIGWRAGVALHLDTAVFEQTIQQAQTAVSPTSALDYWQQTINRYPGDLLPDCYDEWIAPERARLRQLYLQALESGLLLAGEQEAQTAEQLARQLISADPFRESAYRQLMALHVRRGDRAAALRVYYQCVDTLKRELAVEPSSATQEAYHRLLVLHPVATASPAPPMETSLVGRQLEWAQLTALWQQVADGPRSPLILISGEAGVGKSRLAEEFLAWTRQQGGITAVAACYAAETQLAFGPVADWLRGFLPLDNLAPIWRGELARLLPELAPTLPIPISEQWQQRRFYEAIAQAIAAQKSPICLLLEDLQWADSETLAWLHYLLRHEKINGLLLATWRPAEIHAAPLTPLLHQWREQGRLREIHLDPLDEVETTALAATLLGVDLPPDLATLLYQQTEGNPLFVVETLRHALADEAENGVQPFLQGLTQKLQQDKSRLSRPLPPKMLALIKARLTQLSPMAYGLVEAASVIGRSFTIPVLQQASGMAEEALITAVDEMWRRRIVRNRDGESHDFSHGKLRQVAYQSISPARRRWLHSRVAQTLADLAPVGDVGLAGRIAFHYEAAGQVDRAFDYHRQAAAITRRIYARSEEVYHLQQAVAMHGRALAASTLLADLHEQLGEAHTSLGQHDAARRAYAAAQATLPPEAAIQQATLTLRQAKSWLAQYELEKANQLFAQIPVLMGDPATFTTAEWHVWLDARLEQFDVAYFVADLGQMAQMVAETEPLLAQHGDTRQRIRYYQTRAQWHSRQTRFCHTAVGVADAQAAWQLAKSDGDESLIHTAQFGLGFMRLWQVPPDLAVATADLERAAAGSQATGNVPLQDRCLAYLTIAYRLQGNVARVQALLPQSTAVAESEENWPYLGVAGAQRAWLAARARRWNQVIAEAQTALAQWQKSAFPFHWLACWPYLAAVVALAEWSTAVAQAQAMLAPDQHRLPDELVGALETAVSQPTPAHFQHTLALARQRGML